jgi:hypothetical protein
MQIPISASKMSNGDSDWEYEYDDSQVEVCFKTFKPAKKV